MTGKQLYPEFDDMLKESMVRETELFFTEVLTHDMSITNVVASDFSMLNGRLARHYSISDVDGWEFRRVSLPADSHRGGLLTMASVLKVTANGTYTSPVMRGVLVLERVLGTPPSPPGMSKMPRRTLSRAAGVGLALPMLDCFQPCAGADQNETPPRRMVSICTPLGLHPEDFFPTQTGKDYELTPHLKVFGELRDDFTVISGLSHPDIGSSHDSISSFLTGAPRPEIRSGFRNSVSLDQFAADYIG